MEGKYDLFKEKGHLEDETSAKANVTNVTATVDVPYYFSSLEMSVNLPMSIFCLVALASFCRLIYRRVDTEHPVYALLAHCVAVQTAFQTVNVGINLGRSIDLGLAFGKIVHFSAILLTVILRQFYETTWALVTYLRYFFIARKDSLEQSVDFAQLRKKFVRLVWAFFVCHMFLVNIVRLAILRSQIVKSGTGEVTKWADRSLPQRIALLVPVHILSTIPDMFSIVTYFRLRRHVLLEKQRNSVGYFDAEKDNSIHDDIFVGNQDTNTNKAQPQGSQNNIVVCDKEIKCVLTAMKTYSWTHLFDWAIITQGIFGPELGLDVLINLQIWEVWIPLATIAINFGTLRSIIVECLKSSMPKRCSKSGAHSDP